MWTGRRTVSSIRLWPCRLTLCLSKARVRSARRRCWRERFIKPLADAEIPSFVALGRKVAEEGTGTERQKENAKAWAAAAKVFAEDPDKHSEKAVVK